MPRWSSRRDVLGQRVTDFIIGERYFSMRAMKSWFFGMVMAQAVHSADARDWLQFRGTAGGVIETADIPDQWNDQQNLAWRANLPGTGWSSPVVVGKKVFVGTAETQKQPKLKSFAAGMWDFGSGGKPPKDIYEWKVACLDLESGQVLWMRAVAKGQPGSSTHPSNTFASETLVSDGNRIYGYFAAIGKVFCLDFEGKPLWDRDVGAYPTGNGWGTGSSPVLYQGKLFVLCDNPKKSFLTAFDAETGKEAWSVSRQSDTAWSTPYVWNNALRTELVVCGSGRVEAYDPANGAILWQLTNVQAVIASTPASDSERIYFGNNGPFTSGQLFAVKAGASGNITPQKGETASAGVVWSRTKSGPGVSSPVVHGELLYVVEYSGGILGCYDRKTGERVYRQRVPKLRQCAASLLACAGKIYLLGDDGTFTILQAGREFRVLAQNKIDDNFWATPAIIGSTLLLRSANALYCIRQR